MRRATLVSVFSLVALVVTGITNVTAQVYFRQPAPGSVYKEYGRVQTGNELLVTDPNGTGGAQDYLPNPVLYFTIDDLSGALDTADVLITLWGGHEATMGKQVRFNNNAWIDIPELNSDVNGLEPGHVGQCYFQQMNVVIRVPISHLQQGSNSVEGTNGGQHGCIDRFGNNMGWGWGLWGLEAFIVRVYYGPGKPHPTGTVSSVADGGVLIESAQKTVEVSANALSTVGIERVDFLAYYDDYDTDGDGVYAEYHHQYPELPPATYDITDHVGTDFSAPYGATWNTTWVPDQGANTVKLIARIKDNNGYWYVTPEVTGLSLQRSGRSVKLYKPYNVPEQFNLDHGQAKSCNFDINPLHNLLDATAARMYIRTYNGTDADGVPGGRYTKVNTYTVTDPYGANYEYRCDRLSIPPAELTAGENKIEFYGESLHHGIDIMWPGPGVAVEYTGDYSSPNIAAAILLSPSNGATGQSSSPLLQWRQTAGATGYTLQVATDSLFGGGFAVNDSGITDTSRLVTGLANNATFFWRVRARNASGPGPYSAVWHFATSLAAPTLLSPAAGATGLPTTVQLQWTISAAVTAFQVQVGTDSTFATGLVLNDSTVVDTFKTVAGLANATDYFWRVAGRTGGGSGGFSSTRKFRTVVGNAGVPQLLAPANGLVDAPVTLNFRWSTPANAVTYRLQIGTDVSFSTSVVFDDSTIADTTKSAVTLAHGVAYYWRVQAKNAVGINGSFSAPYSFSTIVASPNAPLLLLPANGATNQDTLGLIFRWRTLQGAIKYWFQIATDSNFVSGFLKNDSTVTDSTRTVASGFARLTRYYWRVSGANAAGFGAWSLVYRFTTVMPMPGQAQLMFPANMGLVNADTVRLVWRAIPNAAHYWVEAALDSTFSMRFLDTTATDTAKVLRALQKDQWYFWKVRGGNAGGWGQFSNVYRFQVKITSVAVEQGIPEDYSLTQNYPNPFNPSTIIAFGIPREGRVTLEIYGVLGNKVATLVDGPFSPGNQTVRFDAGDLASGVYFYRLTAGGASIVKRMVFMR